MTIYERMCNDKVFAASVLSAVWNITDYEDDDYDPSIMAMLDCDCDNGWSFPNQSKPLQEETAVLRAQLQEQENEPLECRKYQCLECGHEWLEDCDASDYPDYCPVCGTCLLPQAEDDSNNTMREREVRSTYGETWLAYRRKPGSVHHHEI